MSRQFFLFCVSGGLAFLVDAGIVQSLVMWLDSDPYLARLVSFFCAASFTWWFNRSFTFAEQARHSTSLLKEWTRYLASQTGGGAVNYAVYSALVFSLPLVREWPVLGVAAGSVAGLLVNFLAARHWVFAKRSP